MDELLALIAGYESDWAATHYDVQDAALDAMGAETIDDVVMTWHNMSEDELESAVWLWKDFMSVVRHKEYEMGLD